VCGFHYSKYDSSYMFRLRKMPLTGCDIQKYTVVRHMTTEIRSEKWVVRRFRRCANVTECTYTNLDSTVQPTADLVYTV
jgi:hypothetical protein